MIYTDRTKIAKLLIVCFIAISCLFSMLAVPSSPHEHRDMKMIFVVDRPITTYPEYLELMMTGEVYLVRDGMTAHIVKSEMGWHWLQRLGILVCAE